MAIVKSFKKCGFIVVVTELKETTFPAPSPVGQLSLPVHTLVTSTQLPVAAERGRVCPHAAAADPTSLLFLLWWR